MPISLVHTDPKRVTLRSGKLNGDISFILPVNLYEGFMAVDAPNGQMRMFNEFRHLTDFNDDLIGICCDVPLFINNELNIDSDLTVAGNMTVLGNLSTLDTYAYISEQLQINNSGTGPAVLVKQTGTNPIADFQDDGETVFYIEDGGFVGVRTNDPNYQFSIVGLEENQILLNAVSNVSIGNYTAITLGTDLEDRPKIGFALEKVEENGVGNFHFLLNNQIDDTAVDLSDSRMMIDVNGNVGINTTTPNFNLEIMGDLGVSDNFYLTGDMDMIGNMNVAGNAFFENDIFADSLTLFDNNGALKFNSNDGEKIFLTNHFENGSKISTNNWEINIHAGNLDNGIIDSGKINLMTTVDNISTTRLSIDANLLYIEPNTQIIGSTIFGNNQQIIIDGNQTQIGIGTIDPQHNLHIIGDTKFETNLNTSSFTIIQNGLGDIINLYDNNNVVLRVLDGGDLEVNTNILYVDASENKIGINTNSPSKNLDIKGDAIIEGNSSNTLLELIQNGSGDLINIQQNNDILFSLFNNGDLNIDNNTFYLDANNNKIGLGTNQPLEQLHMTENLLVDGFITTNDLLVQQQLIIDNNDIGPALSINQNGDYNITEFKNDSNIVVVIENEGHVGIGTSEVNPEYMLEVFGNAHVSKNMVVDGNLNVIGDFTYMQTNVQISDQIIVDNNGTGPAIIVNQNGTQPILDFRDDGNSVFFIEDGGNVGIGTLNPDSKLDIQGALILRNKDNDRWRYRVIENGESIIGSFIAGIEINKGDMVFERWVGSSWTVKFVIS